MALCCTLAALFGALFGLLVGTLLVAAKVQDFELRTELLATAMHRFLVRYAEAVESEQSVLVAPEDLRPLVDAWIRARLSPS